MNPSPRVLVWWKSRYSNHADNCVEWARTADGIVVRDSKDPNGPVISLTLGQWRTFVGRVRDVDVVDTRCLWISTEEVSGSGMYGSAVTVWHVRHRPSGTVLRFTAGERDAFLREVRGHGHERTLAA